MPQGTPPVSSFNGLPGRLKNLLDGLSNGTSPHVPGRRPQRLLGTTNIEGKVAPQDLGLPGGQTQKYINVLERLIRQ